MTNYMCTAGLLLALPALLSSLPSSEMAAQETRPRPSTKLPGRGVPTTGQPAPAASPTSAAGSQRESATGCPTSVTAWWKQTAGTGRHGRIVCAKDPTRPAILLFHGSQQDGRAWTAPSYTESAFNHKAPPDTVNVGGRHQQPNSGPYKVSLSQPLYGSARKRTSWDRANNWFDFLVQQGFTVGTWSQDAPAMADAMKSSRVAIDSFLVQTAARSPGAPPAVTLIGHGRGGLLIRQVLKERGSRGRLKAVITLHSPHSGTQAGSAPSKVMAEIVDLVDCCSPPIVTPQFKVQLKQLMVEAVGPTVRSVMAPADELESNSSLMRQLVEGEKKLADVTYYTFGGVSPRLYRPYTWVFLTSSAEPQYDASGQYFVWRAAPVELTGISPVLDKVRDIVPEVAPGEGDGAVTDASSRLPWSIHTTNQLNHLEPLWNKPLMGKVAKLIGGVPTGTTRRR